MNIKNKKREKIIEKIIFFEITRQQFLIEPPKDYWETYLELKEEEKDYIDYEIFKEISKIFNYINSSIYKNKRNIKNIEEYNNEIEKVSDIILKVSRDFNLTLKHTPSIEFLNAKKNILGEDVLNKFLGK